MNSNLTKLLLACLLAALLAVATWMMGRKSGYDKGAKDEAERFQVMLDTNVYWAHRDALRSLKMVENHTEHAVKFHKNRLIDFHKRITEAAEDNPNLDGTIKFNYIQNVTLEHDENLALADEIIEQASKQN